MTFLTVPATGAVWYNGGSCGKCRRAYRLKDLNRQVNDVYWLVRASGGNANRWKNRE